MSDPHEFHMRRAIALSRQGMEQGAGGPFGAVVVRDGVVVGEGCNEVTSTNDPTAHAEVVAIRAACRRLGTFDLSGASIYASCEPCPMCLAAILWARIDRLWYASSNQDATAVGFDDAAFHREIRLPADQRALKPRRLLADEAKAVLAEWAAKRDKVPY